VPRPIYTPPSDFAGRPLIGSAVTITPWFRVHPIDKSAIYFGKRANNRFTPRNSPLGVWYVAEDLHTALYELFGDEMIGSNRRIREFRWLNSRVSEVHFSSTVSVCDFSDEQSRIRLGVDLSALMTPDLDVPQQGALAVMNHGAMVNGIQYQSRFTPRKCLALFDRRNIGATINTKLLGALSSLTEANKFLDDNEVIMV
jgi:RES domain